MERMLYVRLVFFNGLMSRERIDGGFFVGERFMNNDGRDNFPVVRKNKKDSDEIEMAM